MTDTFIELVALVICTLISWLCAEAIRAARAYTQDKRVIHVIARARYAVEVAVGEVAQRWVDDMKRAAADGKLTPEEAKDAAISALHRAKKHLGKAALRELESICEDPEQYLEALIETEVWRRR
jgi:hypothetical protein